MDLAIIFSLGIFIGINEELQKKFEFPLPKNLDINQFKGLFDFCQALGFFIDRLSILPDTSSEMKMLASQGYNTVKTQDWNMLEEKLLKIRERVPIWEDRIKTELIKIKVVRLSTNTMLNPDFLARGAPSFFDNQTWSQLSILEKSDLEDGCRCIALQAYTPAAMVIMRCIESALRTYYKRITGNDSGKKNWGTLTRELSTNTQSDKKLIGYFDFLKDIRNKLDHPDVIFNMQETETTFMHAISIFGIIYR